MTNASAAPTTNTVSEPTIPCTAATPAPPNPPTDHHDDNTGHNLIEAADSAPESDLGVPSSSDVTLNDAQQQPLLKDNATAKSATNTADVDVEHAGGDDQRARSQPSSSSSSTTAADDVDPFPWMPVITLSFCMFTNSFLYLMIFPFMTFMVDDLKVTDDKNKLGVYTGWLTACMMIGALMSSYPWGLFADRFGRRPVMLIGMFSTGILALLFGFSSSYAMAVVWRTLLGLMNGVVTTAKAQMAEVCSQRHMPRGFSIMSVAWGLGAVFGPMVGGWMARPTSLYPSVFPPGSFFDTWAYALPGVFCCVISFAITGIIYVNLPETRIPVRPLPGFLRLLQADYALPGGTGKPPGKKSSKAGSQDDEDELVSLSGPIAYTKPSGADRPMTLIELVKDGPIRITAILYGCTAAIEVSLMEALMLWARLPHEEGGLAFSAADLGVVSSITGAMGLLYQLVLFEPIVKRFGALNLYRAATLVACASHQFMPRIPAMVGFEAPHSVQIVMLAAAQSLFGICGQSVFTSIFILISNAALDKDKGASNGLGQTVASAARIVFPVVSGTLFSLSMYNSAEPFDYHLTFHFCNVLSVLTVLYSFKLDHTINLPRDLADRIHAGEVLDEEVIKGKKVAVDAVHA